MKLVILGASPGGYVAAIRAAQLGADVSIIEKEEVGGTCLNKGCIPTKTILASSNAYARARDLSDFGIDIKGDITPDMKKIVERKDRIVSTQIKGIRSLLKSWNIDNIPGHGKFISSDEIRVLAPNGSEETIKADSFIIATGSRPASIDTLPFDGLNIISSTEALSLTKVPESILIVGAGVIGCEFAFMFRELGSDIIMVERFPRALSTEDESVSKLLERELKKRKIKLLTDVKVDSISIKDRRVVSSLSNGSQLTTSKLLVSIGRSLNSDDIGIENTGIEIGERGEILTDDKMQTNVKNIFAVGDVTGGAMLAHVASNQGIVAAENIMGHDRRFDGSVIPWVIFTSPEIASVGLREHEARDKGIDYIVGEFQFRGLGKAHAMGEIAGFIKIVVEKDTDLVLGAHIVGPHASDLIHECALAIHKHIKAKDIARMIHAHPTLSEGLVEAAEDAYGTAIHAPRK